ncbi:MAG: hypothetical protein AB8I08_08295 [Sandaracinaceae bacterium]
MSEPPAPAVRARLDALEDRLKPLWSDPASLRQQASWLARVWLRLSGAGRGPRFSSDALSRFRADETADELERWARYRESIVREFEENVERLERSARVEGEAPAPILTWLFSLHAWVQSMERATGGHASLALTRGIASRAALGPPPEEDPGSAIALAGIDALLNEAAQETERVSRRRHLLEAARRLLLDAEAAAPIAKPFEGRRAIVATELLHLSRIEQAGVDPHVALSHQVERSARRRQLGRAASACAAMVYLHAGQPRADLPLIVRSLAGHLPSGAPSADELLPNAVSDAVTRGYRRAREQNAAALGGAGLSDVLALRRHRQYLSGDAHLSLLRMALGVDGVFDVGGRLERERIDFEVPTADVVPFPTAELELHPVQEPSEARHAIVEDPRLLLHHLASRRLLQRRFVHRSRRTHRRSGLRAAVRFYLLDGSSSMLGARARMRDAVIVAELASLVSRLERPSERIRSLLYYRYFNSDTDVTRRVASIPDALSAIEEVLGTMRGGRTDIEGALLDSLALITENRSNDVELSRAQIILVTDGAAPLDAALIAKTQQTLDIPVRVSVIALGEPNPELRQLAVEQRAAGLKVLYHQVSDHELDEWERGWAEGDWPAFAADDARLRASLDAPEQTLGELAGLSDRDPSSDDPEALLQGLREVGLDEAHLTEGARARLELARRDERSLRRRFDRLFPVPERSPASVPRRDDDELTVALDALSVVSEVIAVAFSDEATAMRDAIAILERLLRERGLAPARYLELAALHGDVLGPAIDVVRAQVSPSCAV